MSENSKSYSVLGIIALVFAVLSFIPFTGVFLMPVALFISGLSILKENNSMSAITFAIGLAKLFITPTLWNAAAIEEMSILRTIWIILLVGNGVLIAKNSRSKGRVI